MEDVDDGGTPVFAFKAVYYVEGGGVWFTKVAWTVVREGVCEGLFERVVEGGCKMSCFGEMLSLKFQKVNFQ